MAQAISNLVKQSPFTQRNPVNPQASSPAQTALSNMQQGVRPVPFSLMPPSAQPIKSHTVTHPDGTTIAQTYHNPQEGLVKTAGSKPAQVPEQTTMPDIRHENGMHHVPFKRADGSVGYINANGDISN